VLVDLPGSGVEYGHLLLSRMKIASHESHPTNHGSGLLSASAVGRAEGINSAEGPFS